MNHHDRVHYCTRRVHSTNINTMSTTNNKPPPQRVVSLLSAATETLFRLGVGDKLVGRSHECDYPLVVESIPCVSAPRLNVEASSVDIDTTVRNFSSNNEPIYTLNQEEIDRLQPDLIIAQDHCRVCAITPADIKASTSTSSTCQNIPQLILRPSTLNDCLNNVLEIAKAMGVEKRGVLLRTTLVQRMDQLKSLVATQQPHYQKPRVALLEWCDPIMGCGFWLPELVDIAGGIPLFCPPAGGATPNINVATLLEAKPNVVVFALCGFGMTRAAKEIASSWSKEQIQQLHAICKGRVYIVDGNYLVNRSGPRVVESAEALAEAIYPELQGHFGHYGTEYLTTLERAIGMNKANGVSMEQQSEAVTKTKNDIVSETPTPAPAELPSQDPMAAVELQLEHLRSGDMLGAFLLNSQANQDRWCSAERFAQVMQNHDTFCRLLSKVAVVEKEEIQNDIATVVVCLPNDATEMVWTMVSESVNGEVAWRTEKVVALH